MPLDVAKIRQLREAAGLTMQAAADQATEFLKSIGHTTVLNRQRWNDIESGRNPDMRISNVEAVSFVLGTTIDELLTRPQSKPKRRASSRAGTPT